MRPERPKQLDERCEPRQRLNCLTRPSSAQTRVQNESKALSNPTSAEKLPEAGTNTQVVAATIEKIVTAIRLEAERRDLGAGTVVISAYRLRHIMREFFLG